MRRRDISVGLITATVTASVAGSAAEAQTRNAPGHARTGQEAAAGVTPADHSYLPGDVQRYGADPTGAADSSAAINRASAVGQQVTFPPGAYLVKSSLTVSPPIQFAAGASVRPAKGVAVTLSSAFQAPLTQIFDLSLGGVIKLPRSCGEVWAEWWGARGDLVKTNNEIPINQAITALTTASGGTYGGYVNLARGLFYVSGSINLSDNVSLRGHGLFYTLIKSYNPGWTTAAQMILGQYGTAPMFNSRVEELRLDASDNSAITAVIYGPGWQQKCGTDNVYVANFMSNGIQLDSGYGGAAQIKIRRTEVYAARDCVPGSACIRLDYPAASVGWISVELDEVDTGSAVANLPNSTGVRATGRVIVNVNDLHSEQQANAVLLDTAATLVGTSLTADGNPTVTNLIRCAPTWTGTINLQAVMRAGAANFILDDSRGPYALANAPGTAGYPGATARGGAGGGGYSQQVIWPPDPCVAVAAMMLTVSGTTITVRYCSGGVGVNQALTVVRRGTGTYVYTCAIPNTMDGVDLYDVMAVSDQPQTAVSRTSATSFTVTTRDSSGARADPTSIGVRVYHSP